MFILFKIFKDMIFRTLGTRHFVRDANEMACPQCSTKENPALGKLDFLGILYFLISNAQN